MKKKEIYIVLDNIRSRENVGSIFRTADGAGVTKIYLCGITPTPKNVEFRILNLESDKIAKTALGAEKWVLWEYYRQTSRCLSELKIKNENLKIIGLEKTKNSQSIFSFKPKFPVALVVGNEVKGLSTVILKKCDKIVAIPMYGKKESLNVAVAAGIAVYIIRYT